MLLKKLKDFHERTMEQYKEEENLEPWKKKVMELHEKSAFLFYYDATLEENAEQNSLIIQGSLVEGELPIGSTVYLYTGEGKYLGSGRILSEPEEKEQGRRGLFKRRRNQFNLGLDEYLGKKVEKMKSREKTKMFIHSVQSILVTRNLYSPYHSLAGLMAHSSNTHCCLPDDSVT